MSKKGFDINAFFFESPQFFTYTDSEIKINVVDDDSEISDVITQEAIKSIILTAQIAEKTINNIDATLFAANLFPYGNIILNAKAQAKAFGITDPKLVLHPVGSDIWQIGPKIKSTVKFLLDNPNVTSVLTYSSSFISEIKEYYNIEREIDVLPPVLESSRFFVLNESEKALRKRHLGLFDDYFIIHHHSSMRRVKSPEMILKIAINASQLINRKCILIMVGPIPSNILKDLKIDLIEQIVGSLTKYKSLIGNLTILWTGIMEEVEYTLQIADVEINASLHDSFNLSLMEALACGVPVVTSDLVGINEHITASKSGFSVPTKRLNFDQLNHCLNTGMKKDFLFDLDYAIQSIVTLSRSQELIEEMGKRGADYILENFNFDKISSLFYKHLI